MSTRTQHFNALRFTIPRFNAPLINRFLLVFILFVAALLRFYHLGHSSLWSDEGNTWALLSRSFAQIARDAAADIHPPGYYWLLKLWTTFFGTTVIGMRSFSALLGLILVYFVYRIGLLLQHSDPKGLSDANVQRTSVALLAAFLTALNPFQIYYSQEARMYMLLTVASAGLIWSLLGYLHMLAGIVTTGKRNGVWGALLGYTIFGCLGLWTHYSFPIVLLAAGLGYLSAMFSSVLTCVGAWYTMPLRKDAVYAFWAFFGANVVVVLLYLPWLPTAVNRIYAWPAGGETVSLMAGVQITLQTLLIGPLEKLPEPQWLWLAFALILPLLGGLALYWGAARANGIFHPTSVGDSRTRVGISLIVLWFALPIGLMFGAGLFTDAFLKFLLVASPAWLLLAAAAIHAASAHRITMVLGMLVIVGGGVALAYDTLPDYYNDPTARDNYAGVAAYIQAVADPTRDLVVLDAPGQQEVWAYYDPGLPIIALPQGRPPDRATTLMTLQNAIGTTQGQRNLYALFWATDEADPERLVETWLDQHAFKGVESWQGNLRFVLYTLSETMDCAALPQTMSQAVRWGASIQLTGHCLLTVQPTVQPTVNAGEVALIGLQWQTKQPLTTRYKVTVQLLDVRNQVIAQRDSEPAGGSRPTDSWQPGETILDNHGILIPVGTPPGTYRLIIALYDGATGVRLPMGGSVAEGDYYPLDGVTISTPSKPLPAALIDVQHRLNWTLEPVTLVGYRAHRQGMAHAPETLLTSGDFVEFTFVWQAPIPLPTTWPDNLAATVVLGTQQVTFPLAGEAYPTVYWSAGQLLQYTIVIPFDGLERYPQLQIGGQRVSLKALPVP